MIDRTVEKIKRKLRRLKWYQKLHLRAWLNTWYHEEYKKWEEE